MNFLSNALQEKNPSVQLFETSIQSVLSKNPFHYSINDGGPCSLITPAKMEFSLRIPVFSISVQLNARLS